MQMTLFIVVILGFLTVLVLTVLALIGRISVSARIRATLVSGVLVALAAAVYQAFDEIDFGEQTAQSFVASLPDDVQEKSPEATRDAIIDLIRIEAQCDANLAAMHEAAEQQTDQLTTCESKLGDLQSVNERHFLFRLLRFDDDAARLGVTLNLTAPPDSRKPDLAQRLIGLLVELGEYEGGGELSPDEAKRALVQYQEKRNMSVTGWYGPATFQRMVEDYASIIAGGRRNR